MTEHLPDLAAILLHAFRIDIDHNALAAELSSRIANKIGILHCGRVDRYLVATRLQQRADIVESADAAANSQRHEDHFRGPPDDVQQNLSLFMTGGDVEENEFVGPFLFIAGGNLHGVAGVAQIQEIRPFDDSSAMNVKTGDNTFGQHKEMSERMRGRSSESANSL